MPEGDDEQFLRTIAAGARRVPPASSDLDQRIMAAVRATPEPWWRAVFGWLLAPRPVRLSPIGGLAYAVGLAAAVFVGVRLFERSPSPLATRDLPSSIGRPVAATHPASDSVRVVRFVLVAPEAASVAVVGDFNRWSPVATPLRPAGVGGVWTVDVPLPAGRHEYAFVVDGVRWLPDPTAPRAPAADFGTPNSVVTVTPELS